MKRVLLHLIFWSAYLVQDALLEFLWVGPSISQVPEHERLWMAINTCVVILIPKLIFTYFVLYVIISKMLKANSHFIKYLLLGILSLMITLLLYKMVFNYFVYPVIYKNLIKTPSFFNMRGFLFALMDIGFVAGTTIAIHQLRRQLAGKEQEKNLLKEKLETELKFLRNQTNPHFLFNTLNNIYALARKKSDNTADVVMKLSKILRFMLYESNKDFITIGEEIKLAEDYLELEKIRYNGRLSIVFNKEIDNNSHQIAPLLLLPFIENAFKHGVSESRFNSYINICLKLNHELLEFTIENSVENSNTGKPTEQIGLRNVKRQLELMYTDYYLDVKQYDATFKVNLTIKLDSRAKI